MTISSTATRKAGPYAGNGSTVAFAFSFKVFADSDLVVTHTDDNGLETVKTLDHALHGHAPRTRIPIRAARSRCDGAGNWRKADHHQCGAQDAGRESFRWRGLLRVHWSTTPWTG